MEDLSEQEQIDAIRQWWQENRAFVLVGAALGIALILGINYYRAATVSNQTAASELYEDVMEAAETRNLDSAVAASDRLYDEHGDSVYAAQSTLAMARVYMDNGMADDAASALQTLSASQKYPELADVARLRLAKVMLYQNKAAEVVEMLNSLDESAFSAAYYDVLGDAYYALESYDEASAAYVSALNDNSLSPTVDRNLIQLKLNDLPLTAATAVEAIQSAPNTETEESE